MAFFAFAAYASPRQLLLSAQDLDSNKTLFMCNSFISRNFQAVVLITNSSTSGLPTSEKVLCAIALNRMVA
jgi:hypothetical protein